MRMARVDENGNPRCGSISGLLRKCDQEGTLNNPRRGYWKFSEDFEDKLYTARVDAGEFDRDSGFDKQKQDKRASFKEKRRKYLEETDWQYKLFDEMLWELQKKNTVLFLKLHFNGATKPMLVLDKYFVEGRRVTAIMGEGHTQEQNTA